MIAFSGLIVWTIIACELSKRISHNSSKRVYCRLMFFATVILQGLRSIYIGGVDTSLVYAEGFERAMLTPFAELPKVFSKDLLFYILTKIFTYVCTDFHVYVFLISAFAMWSFSRYTYKHSDYPVLTYLLYYALGYYAVGFQMLRHVIALSILLYSYDFLIDRNLLKFTLVVLLAGCFHSSALIFFIAYPIVEADINWKQWIVIVFTILATYLAKGLITDFVNIIISGMDRYSHYMSNVTQLSLMGCFILLCVYIASFVFSYPVFKRDQELTALLNLSAVSIVFMALVTVVGEFHRISMFFGIYNTILLPKAWKKYSIRNSGIKLMLIFVIMTIFVFYFLIIGLENYDLEVYKFFWEE